MRELDEQSFSEAPKPHTAVKAFEMVCEEFSRLIKEGDGISAPMWGGTWSIALSLFRHPKKYMGTLRESARAQARVGTLFPFFPIQKMCSYLRQYSGDELKAIKSLSELHARRSKSMLTENLAFKVGLPIGSAYALLEIGNKLVTRRGSSLDMVHDILSLPFVQAAIGYLLFGFLLMFIMMAFQFLVTIGPTIVRAQLLDDVLAVALIEKQFEGKSGDEP
jgi:hypothetical protein